MRPQSKREILMCHDLGGKVPFRDWPFRLLDDRTRARIEARLDRLEDGNVGDVESIGEGLYFGPGYRIYFGQKGNEIHLIRGGTKRTQTSNIAVAKAFWSRHDR